MSLVDSVTDLLYTCVNCRQVDFSGVGILVSTNIQKLPVIAMRRCEPEFVVQGVGEQLAAVSAKSCIYHDGFHILSPACEVIGYSHYFSPPIITSISLPENERFGGRYLAALYGSMIDGVELSATVSVELELSVIRRGESVVSEYLA